MLLANISIFPLDKGVSLSPYVAECLDIIDKSGLDYTLGSMATTIEGEYEEVFDVIKRCFNAVSMNSERVSMYIKVDWRKGASKRLIKKISSVEGKLGRKLRHE